MTDEELRQGTPNLYKFWKIPKYLHKKIVGYRTIEEPIPELKVKQKELVKFLESKIIFPSYVFGVRGTSAIDNAKYHQNAQVIIKIDILSFFPSTHDYQINDGIVFDSSILSNQRS